ncbi:MAG: DUF1330 domain-containing protein [Pseudomonadota bacterium]
MAKAYWIASVDVTNPDAYANYVAEAPAAIAAHGGRFMARGGEAHQLEGEGRSRNVIIEFPSLAQARACWESDAYQRARTHRETAGDVSIVVVEGVSES